jgi:superfamily II DNA or RNA helicase
VPVDPPLLNPISFALNKSEQVLRQQLNVKAYWSQKTNQPAEIKDSETTSIPEELPAKWRLTNGIDLHDWQADCLQKWMNGNGKGVIKVVTGAGKTVLALALAERLQNEKEPELRVAIVVPTVVLMEQWYSILVAQSNLPPSAIGCLGGGYSNNFDDKIRILVTVLNTASTKLSAIARGLNHPLLLVVDECHRTGAQQMSRIYEAPRAYSLGLSATPERDELVEQGEQDEAESLVKEEFDDSVLGRELGPILFELDYLSAIERGILSPFVLKHYGLPLDSAERAQYEKLSRDITELRKSLQGQMRGRALDGGALVGWARRIASRGSSPLAQQASQYVQATGQRKLMLYHAKARASAVSRLVAEAVAEDSKVILFHESVAEVMNLFAQLSAAGHQVVVEHSQLSDSLRQESIRLFRDGSAQILVSARTLIEGFDVPAADVGIVVASSSSVRQRIQTLGRILRKKKDQASRTAILHVLYMADTTDEMIYEKEDWEKFTGAERNQYFVWDPDVEDSLPLSKDSPPRRPKPRESEIDLESLRPGEDYLGAYEGDEFTADSQGNIRAADGSMVTNPQNIPAMIHELRGSFGRFRITSVHRAIVVPAGDGRLVFGGILAEPFLVQASDNIHPTSSPRPIELEVRTRSDGPRIMLKIRNGEIYAKRSDTANDAARGRDAEKLASALAALQREKDVRIRKISLDSTLEVFTEIAGQRETIAHLEVGLEFNDRLLP